MNRRFFELTWDIGGEFGVEAEPPHAPGHLFATGAPLTHVPRAPLDYTVNHSRNHPPAHMVICSTPLMSLALVETIEAAGVANLQRVACRLTSNIDGACWPDYVAVNVVGLVACADLSRSDFIEIMPRADQDALPLLEFDELVIDARKTGDALMFRLAESPATIVVAEPVVRQLRARNTDAAWGITLFELEVA